MTPCTDNFMGVGLPSARARSESARRAVRQRAEQGFVEQFIAQAFDERLDKCILDRLAGRCSASCDRRPIARWRSRSARCRCRSRSSWACRVQRGADRARERPGCRRSRCRHQRQAFARAVVDHDEDAQAAAIDKLIGDEVERPAVIRPLWNCQWRPRDQGPLAPAAPADQKAAIQPKSVPTTHSG